MSERERPRVQPVDLAASYAAVDQVESRLLADGEFRARYVRGGRQTDEQRRKALGLDVRAQSSAGQPRHETLADRLDALSAEQRDQLRQQIDAADDRATWGEMTPEEQASDTEDAFLEAEMEEVQEFNETGTWDDPSGLEAA
jgi:hypothetical protein